MFSMFPRDAPGVALVLLRFSVAVMLWIDEPLASAHLARHWVFFGLILVTTAVCVGILTPPVAVLCVLFEGIGLFYAEHAQPVLTIVSISDALALALLGPGAYSIDAWLFGRQVFVVSPGKEPDTR